MTDKLKVNICVITLFFCLHQFAYSGSDLIGKPAPEFSLPVVNKNAIVQMKTFTGKVILIDFWATWCAPCKKALPKLSLLQNKYDDKIQVLAISVDDKKSSASKFLNKFKIDLLSLHDTKKSVADVYAVPAMPTLFIVDKKGILRYMHDGYTEADLPDIESEIRKLL
jgi:thiol-disulfide isomerase/thioredoxin